MVNFPSDPVKAKDISRFDENAASLGIPKAFLMECAGLQATNKIVEKYALNASSKVIIFAGLGNNGGDGLVIARHLAARGISVVLALIGDASKIRTDESRLNWDILHSLVINCVLRELKDFSSVLTFSDSHSKPDIVIDALLGTGVKGIIREPIASAIDVINSYSCPKISIDVPTGVDPDSGQISHKAVKCDFRIGFHRDKIGLINQSNSWIAPIGIPLEAHLFIGEGDLKQCIKHRPAEAHKGEFGKMLVIGGSDSFAGAPALAALAGIEFGLDLVIALVPQKVANVVRNYSPNLIVKEGTGENLCPSDFEKAKNLSNWADVVVVGPGLGTSPETRSFYNEFLKWALTNSIKCVIDADAIRMTGELLASKEINSLTSNCLLTPHINELLSLVSLENLPKNADILSSCDYFQQKFRDLKGNYLIKGKNDYIIPESCAHPLKIRINTSGCAEMSVGGTGDVLAGLCGAFIAIGNDLFQSAGCAAYLNGKLGEIAKKTIGPRIKATDLLFQLHSFLKNKNL